MLLDHALLNPSDEVFDPVDFKSCLNAEGLYSPQLFVLKLSPRNHALVNGLVAKTPLYRDEIDDEALQAYSTYLHETVHWWQHKGSTSGFVRSMLYPSQTTANMQHLFDLTALVGPKKPILTWAENMQRRNLSRPQEADVLANIIINNFKDTEFYLALTYKPELAVSIYDDIYFECAGHSFHVAYDLVLGALRDNVDPESQIFPDGSEWEKEFMTLENQKTEGYYYGTPVRLAPVGLLHIFEGQARFIQLQFLSFARGGMSLREARVANLLEGEYGKAFEVFLKMTNSDEPEHIDDPLVALFMLICDLSINPTAGFPSQIVDFENFYLDADPGIRFAVLCDSVARCHPELRTFIKSYSRDEYLEAASLLTDACGYESPMRALESIASWETKQPEVARLMEEHRTFEFGPPNLAIRVLLAEFIEFCKDKLQRPEFFCWAGAWMVGTRNEEAERELWLKHLSLYSDREEDGGIFPRMIRGRSKEAIYRTFNNFYVANMTYDMTRQWVLQSGLFKFDFSKINKSIPEEVMTPAVKEVFKKQFGVSIDDFQIVS